MIGGGLDASQPEPPGEHAPNPEDVHQVLDRLRSRIEEVAAWAEHASFPGSGATAGDGIPAVVAPDGIEPDAEAIGQAPGSPGARDSDSTDGTARTSITPPLDFLRTLARSGAVAGGVFSIGTEIIDLTESHDAAQVPESGLVALLNLVPSDTVLEVRTRSTELRAARLGDDAFAVELAPGSEREIDDWLASLLPSSEA